MKQLPINTLYRRERVVSVAHSLQMMCEANPELTITSVDGVSAFDLISRRAMLEGLGSVEGGPAAFSFVHMFCGRPSTYLWEDAEGTVHTINQGEGSEQRDALMPLLFSCGPTFRIGGHSPAVASEHIVSLTSTMCTLRRSQTVQGQCAPVSRRTCMAMLAFGSTWARHTWESTRSGTSCLCSSAAGSRSGQPSCSRVEGILPTDKQGIRVLGAPVGHPETLLEMIPLLLDVQSAWMMLLHCPLARAIISGSFVPNSPCSLPPLTINIVGGCLSQILGISTSAAHATVKASASLPLGPRWVGIAECSGLLILHVWASWADCLLMTRRHRSSSGSQHGALADHSISLVIGRCCSHHS